MHTGLDHSIRKRKNEIDACLDDAKFYSVWGSFEVWVSLGGRWISNRVGQNVSIVTRRNNYAVYVLNFYRNVMFL